MQNSTIPLQQDQDTSSLNRGSFILNPESMSMFDKRRNFIRVKAMPSSSKQTQQTQSKEQLKIYEDLKDLKRSHFKSQYKNLNSPGDKQSQSLNRDFSMKVIKTSNSKNQLYLRKSILSRNSSARSFERSQKEILSPFYKPFEIFFSFRKKSPYLSQRSKNNTTIKSRDQTQLHTSKFIARSQTPSFATSNLQKEIERNEMQSSKTVIEGNKTLHFYLNHHIKNSISQKPSDNKLPSESSCSHEKQKEIDQCQNDKESEIIEKKISFVKGDDDLDYSSDEEDIERRSNLAEPLLKVDCEIQTEDQLIHQCCHIEGQRHQLTRYALEKSLKLSQILMCEIQRLDTIIQNSKSHLIQEPLQQKHETQQPEEESQDFIEKKQMSKIKRELFKEIENLNNVNDITKPDRQSLGNLYKSDNNYKEHRSSFHFQHHKKEHKENQYIKQTQSLLTDVTNCFRSYRNKNNL